MRVSDIKIEIPHLITDLIEFRPHILEIFNRGIC